MTHPFARRSLSLVALSLVALVALLSGCRKSDAPGDSSALSAPAAASATPAGAVAAPRSRAITVDTTLKVGDVDTTARTVREALERSGGYVADASSSGTGDDRTAHFDVRVPAESLRAFLAAIAGTGETASYTERTEDVTDQVTDLKARLTNARAQEKRVLELMATRTSGLGEVLEAEKELARIRETIERLDAQDRAIGARVSYATVRVSIVPHAVPAFRTPGKSIAHAAETGLKGAAAFFVYAAMAVVTVGPTLLPFALLVVAVMFVMRRRAEAREALAAKD